MKRISGFAAGTPLLTPDGDKHIDQFRPGDWVLAAPEDDPHGQVQPRRVAEVFRFEAALITLRVFGKTIRTTAEHPFWVDGNGWTRAADLIEGDRLRSHDGRWAVVMGVADEGETEAVFNLCIDQDHTYFVGAREWGFSVWAHNACSGTSGDNKYARYGRKMHEEWNYGEVYMKEVVPDNRLTPDAVNWAEKKVIELKPDSEAAMHKGWAKLQQYIEQLQKQAEGDWQGFLETYPHL